MLYEKCGMGWVDAPVSGGVSGAEQGSLAIMAGGSIENINIARTVLAPLYKQLTHMGDVGSGQVTKICNQMIVSCNVLVIAEMMALAKQAGVAAEKIPEALVRRLCRLQALANRRPGNGNGQPLSPLNGELKPY